MNNVAVETLLSCNKWFSIKDNIILGDLEDRAKFKYLLRNFTKPCFVYPPPVIPFSVDMNGV